MAIHDFAARGFERGAQDYEKGRPSYPDGVIGVLRDRCGLGPGCDVVDIAAGTGKFTRLLEAERPSSIVAVEPVDGMRAELVARSPNVRAVAGTAEATGLDDGCADLVTIAQAFHWFTNDGAVRELARILRPGGHLALVWNTRDQSVPWEAAIDVIMTRLAGDAPRFRANDTTWQRPIDRSGAFGPIETARFTNTVRDVDLDLIRARVTSTSYVSALDDAGRAAVVAEVDDICRDAGKDGRFDDEYLTDLFWCRRLE